MSSNQLTFERVKVPLSNGVQEFEGCCEFAGAQVYPGAGGRKCRVDKSYCGQSIYADSAVFLSCFLRKQELAQQKKREQA